MISIPSRLLSGLDTMSNILQPPPNIYTPPPPPPSILLPHPELILTIPRTFFINYYLRHIFPSALPPPPPSKKETFILWRRGTVRLHVRSLWWKAEGGGDTTISKRIKKKGQNTKRGAARQLTSKEYTKKQTIKVLTQKIMLFQHTLQSFWGSSKFPGGAT